MAAERIAIVGAGPAGLATARAYRERGGAGELTLIGAEPRLPHRRPPLTKEFLRGELDARELAIEQREWFDEHGVQLHLGRSVREIDPRRGALRLAGEREGESSAHATELRADAIVLATGAEPLRPDIPGLDDDAVMTMRAVPDSVELAVRARASAERGADGERASAKPLAVIGTGFIGCEIAASLALVGARVTLIGQEPRPQQARLGERAGERIAGWLAELGVELIAGAEVGTLREGRTVELVDGRRIEAASIVLGMGVSPRSDLARAAGLPLHEGAVVVDGSMRVEQASREAQCAVFAVGDVAYAYNACAGRRLRVEHWGDALGQGEVAGSALAGEPTAWDSVPGFWSTIGEHTLKYAAWGDGHDDARFEQHDGGAFTVWYSRGGALVGVLTHERDEDYERGRELIGAGAAIA
ncbi:MAG TPA: FAD-dependent oxidoreductase [Solirubrobacteraceae bacterium]|nr:FAD-dependent oxidoreductase [Solirubrobacteraceae bacterium]